MAENIHPIFDTVLSTEKKEDLLRQTSLVIWMVGLSGSGKSTLARALENELYQQGYLTALLDGDNLRSGINKNLSFTKEDRIENIRRAAEISKLFAMNGVITICSLISPTKQIRDMARAIVGEKFCEVFINCPIEVCESRDVKGLYAKARKGEIPEFTGISSPFENPTHADINIDTANQDITESLKELMDKVSDKIRR